MTSFVYLGGCVAKLRICLGVQERVYFVKQMFHKLNLSWGQKSAPMRHTGTLLLWFSLNQHAIYLSVQEQLLC